MTIGDKIKLNWTADHDYVSNSATVRGKDDSREIANNVVQTLSMSFMKRNIGASQMLSSVFYDLPMASGNMSYDWIVPNITVVAGE